MLNAITGCIVDRFEKLKYAPGYGEACSRVVAPGVAAPVARLAIAT